MSCVRRLVGALAVTSLLAGCGGSHPALRLRGTYLGLTCNSATITRCDRLGLAVWLLRPASNATAVVDGVSVHLRSHSGGTGRYRRWLFWQGFFRDPHAQRLANASDSIPVHLKVTAPSGSISAGTRTTFVSSGYG